MLASLGHAALAPLDAVAALIGLPIWLTYSVAFLIPAYLYLTWNFGRWTSVGIPGPRPWPLIGNMDIQMRKGFVHDNVLVRRFGRIMGLFEGRRPFLLICEAEAIKELTIKQFDSFHNRRTADFPTHKEMKGSVSLVEGESWKGMRNVITPTFSAAKMKRLSVMISETGKDFVTAIDKLAGSEVDMKDLSGNFTMDVVGKTLFGIETNCQEHQNSDFVKWSKKAFDFSFANPKFLAMLVLPTQIMMPLCDFFNVGLFDWGVVKFFRDQVNSVLSLRESQKEKPVDFLQLMLDAHETEMEAHDDGVKVSALESTQETYAQTKNWRVGKRALTRHEILANAMIFFMVGYETTASALSWMLHLLAFHDDVQEKLFQEIHDKMDETNGKIGYDEVAHMPYLDQVFCETLRIYPSAQRSDRVCNRSSSVGGTAVREGEMVMLGIWAIHHDPEYWPEPEEFRPDRFSPENKADIVPYSWIPFGAGPRNCVGMRLAIMEAKIGLAYALNKFRFSPGPNSLVFRGHVHEATTDLFVLEERPVLSGQGFSAPKSKKLPLLVTKRE